MYYRAGKKVTYGYVPEYADRWGFDAKNALIGLHGYMDGNTIKQLGFITYTTDDAKCPTPVTEEEPIEEEVT